jgi:UDP-glucose 4-epimerase
LSPTIRFNPRPPLLAGDAWRRAGDIASCYTDPAQALALLGWRAERGLDAMCADAWRWQTNSSVSSLRALRLAQDRL